MRGGIDASSTTGHTLVAGTLALSGRVEPVDLWIPLEGKLWDCVLPSDVTWTFSTTEPTGNTGQHVQVNVLDLSLDQFDFQWQLHGGGVARLCSATAEVVLTG